MIYLERNKKRTLRTHHFGIFSEKRTWWLIIAKNWSSPFPVFKLLHFMLFNFIYFMVLLKVPFMIFWMVMILKSGYQMLLNWTITLSVGVKWGHVLPNLLFLLWKLLLGYVIFMNVSNKEYETVPGKDVTRYSI